MEALADYELVEQADTRGVHRDVYSFTYSVVSAIDNGAKIETKDLQSWWDYFSEVPGVRLGDLRWLVYTVGQHAPYEDRLHTDFWWLCEDAMNRGDVTPVQAIDAYTQMVEHGPVT